MNFIKVTADQCNQQGHTSSKIPRSEFHLNIDLIGAIKNGSILLKGGEMINLGRSWYKNITLAQGEKISN